MAYNTTPLIPRRLFFGNPDKVSPSISPDGSKLAYLAPVDGVLNVWVSDTGAVQDARPVSDDTVRGIRSFRWAYTNEHIIYIQDKGGDENWHIYSVNLNTGETVDLSPIDGVNAQIQQASVLFPDELLVGLNDRNQELHDIHRVNINSGERTLVLENPGFPDITTDREFNVRLAMRISEDGGAEAFQYNANGADGESEGEPAWEPFATIGSEDLLTTGVYGFDKSGDIAYMIDSRGRDTAALTSYNVATGTQTVVAENDRADISDIMMHPTERHIQAFATNYERVEWEILDESIVGDMEMLKTVADGEVNVISRTLDDQIWIASYLMDDGPVRYYRYDRTTKEATFLFTDRDALAEHTLAKMTPITIKSRDGLNLVCYYSLPAGSDTQTAGIPDKSLPMVLYVHGGPWARDQWGYHPIHQLLANRGYAVLSVNYRGSTGFGKNFINAANLEWAGKMHDDLIDAVDWAIAQGIADANQVAIMGGSYGGFATLVGMTFTPEKFVCGVDIVGPSNLITFIESIPPYWKPMLEMLATRVGDPRTEEGKAHLVERSPLTHVDNIQKPLLIAQGANDPRVVQAESDQIVEAMQAKGIPITYMLYPEEGHGFARPENSLSFFAAT
ncbi:MAG: S9 family peptidase, partial [Chloroflexota bacterium]